MPSSTHHAIGLLRPRAVSTVSAVNAPSDGELVARACDGDRWAEEALYRRFVGQVMRVAERLLGRHGEAEDVVQETFAIALERLNTLRDADAVGGWLTQIAVSLAHRRFRRRKILRWLGLDRGTDDALLAQLAAPDASPEVRAELARLDRVLATLPEAQRVAWILRRVEGLPLETVARSTECSLATVKRRIATADACVRAHVRFGDDGAEPGFGAGFDTESDAVEQAP